MNVSKKLLLATATAALMGSAGLANASGFYLGAQAGWNDTSIEAEVDGDSLEGLSATGVAGSVIAGFQTTIPGGFVGLEVNAGDSSAEFEMNESNAQMTITSDLSYGVSAMLGTNISKDTQFYGLVGYQATDMEATARAASIGSVATVSEEETFSGARFGVGMQSSMTDSLKLRAQWTRTLYGEEAGFEPEESVFSVGVLGFF